MGWLMVLSTLMLCQVFARLQARKGNRTLSFYTMPEYESWREDLQGSAATGWEIKYYKGLGTSSGKEAKEYFSAMDYHKKNFVWEGMPL